MKTHILYFYLIFSFCLLKVSAQDCNDQIYEGEGTYYDGVAGGTSGNCSLPVTTGDIFHCALNNINYDNSNACGACIEVTGAKGSVILQVVDRCPECASGDVDMTEEAFAMIADVIDGRVPISWKFVPCELDSSDDSIKINFKEGSSEYWTAIQFRNSRYAISTMEYQVSATDWKSVDRVLFNFFIETDGIPSPMNLRITPIIGEPLIFDNIPLNLNADYNTGKQFSIPLACQTLSVEEIETQENTFVYPNPTSDIFYLTQSNTDWTLISGSGKIVNKGNSQQIDMSGLPKGLYILLTENQHIKLIKE
ncbi:hypothetical protein GCM10022393_30730 [Aquimarina addita]|uniref:Expansin-like EG45 domain-containing protein n=1 Tax=Aquimarina addita TaxID=870485 RepID=A0ABP6US94_9FLAO